MNHAAKLTCLLTLLLLFIFLSACSQDENNAKGDDHLKTRKYTNRLINESSPYLLQHANNPVNWYPWGEEALQKAKKESKPIIISIGYSACHWCHVMEKESFEDEEVAQLMNEHFISIKVDREERPDIDQIYIDVAQMMTGSAGWPLNVITLPDTRPFFAGTYFPKDRWLSILKKTVETYKSSPEKLQRVASDVTEGLRSMEEAITINETHSFSKSDIKRTISKWKLSFDLTEGGYKRAQKFPLPGSLQTLLQYQHLTVDQKILDFIELTLDKIGDGGIYDHLQGGFARYSTDRLWRVPHFEKMLYDNAQLISLYAQAYKATGKNRYQEIVEESIGFLERELRSPQGGFYSSLDADSEGEEGKYYVWTYDEIVNTLEPEENRYFIKYFNIEERGNWEHGKNILYRTQTDKDLAEALEISIDKLKYNIESSIGKLLKARQKRPKPGLDDKILTAWNSLMIIAYADAYEALGKKVYRQQAIKTAGFLKENLLSEDYTLYRNYKSGKASINGFLDDYAFTIQAFISLYQITFDETWLYDAQKLTDEVINQYYDDQKGFFYFTSDEDEPLITRKVEITDNVIPSSNSIMAKNLFLLGHYFYNKEYLGKSSKMLKGIVADLPEYNIYYYNWFSLLFMEYYPFYEVAVVGDNYNQVKEELNNRYIPNILLLGGRDEGSLELLKNKRIHGETFIYVCRNKSCKLPVTDVKKAIDLINFDL